MHSISKLDEYQKQARETAVYPLDRGIEYTALGLAGEAGEVANKVKKVIRDDLVGPNGKVLENIKDAIVDELGDVLWYVAELATNLGVTLSQVAEQNLTKLNERKKQNLLKGSGDSANARARNSLLGYSRGARTLNDQTTTTTEHKGNKEVPCSE